MEDRIAALEAEVARLLALIDAVVMGTIARDENGKLIAG